MKISEEAYKLVESVYQHVVERRTEITAPEIAQSALDAARNQALEDAVLICRRINDPDVPISVEEVIAEIRALKVKS